jgi:hypothetical protein
MNAEIRTSEKPETHSGTMTGWRIEYRCTSHHARVVGGMILEPTWRELPIDWAKDDRALPTKIPVGRLYRDLIDHGLLSYCGAQAHRWAFIAALDAATFLGAHDIETRLIPYKLKYHKEISRAEGTDDPASVTAKHPDPVSS